MSLVMRLSDSSSSKGACQPPCLKPPPVSSSGPPGAYPVSRETPTKLAMSLLAQIRRFFSAHPLLFLLLLAPQVEYLTGSSQPSWLIGNPPLFFLFLLQNLGSYGLTVVLAREAQ